MKSTKKLKSVGNDIKTVNAGWTFSGDVAKTFEDHIRQSIPLYDAGHDMVVKLSDYFVKNGSMCYEIGSSTGLLSYMLAQHNINKKAKFVGVEIEDKMHKRALETYKSKNLKFVRDDILQVEFEKADLIVSYYTVQFIRPSERQRLINKIYEALNWGGAFIMFEKVRGSDARFQDICTTLYNDFKLENGFSAEEILMKTQSLKGILEPFSTKGNYDMMERAGFVDMMTVMKHTPFEGFLAIK
jgi:tRNA (cmo5U34)-methyltransferase